MGEGDVLLLISRVPAVIYLHFQQAKTWDSPGTSRSVKNRIGGRMVEHGRIYTMALNIKNVAVEKLAAEVATLAHETKTEAIRRALVERQARLQARAGNSGRRKSLRDYLEQNVWPLMPASELGRVMSREEEDEILGYGPEGY